MKGYALQMEYEGKENRLFCIYDPRTRLARIAWFPDLITALEAMAIIRQMERASHFRGARPVLTDKPDGYEE